MHAIKLLVATVALLSTLVSTAWATPSFGTSAAWNAVPTFQSIGLYWKPTSGGTAQPAFVRFRVKDTTSWREGHELWWDNRNAEYRSSLVELQPNTVYDIQLKLGAGGWVDTTTSCDAASASNCRLTITDACTTANEKQCTRTWNDDFTTAANTITVPAGITHIAVVPVAGTSASGAQSGTTYTVSAPTGSSGFTRIVPDAGDKTITGDSTNNACVAIKHGTQRVIVSGFILENCKQWGVHFELLNTTPGTRDVVIDDNEIRGWGRAALDDGAVHCNEVMPDPAFSVKPERVVVQRNNINNPRHSANFWGFGQPNPQHPRGPQGVYFGRCGGNHVFRWNDIYSTNGNHYNDAIGGCCNFDADSNFDDNQGFPGYDSDIQGNRLTHIYDDGVEAEGPNRNVRIWGNYVDLAFQPYANVVNREGPLYFWRNLSNTTASMSNPNLNSDNDSRGAFVKAGNKNNSSWSGRAYYYHNTVLQPPAPSGMSRTLGAVGLQQIDGPFFNFVSNNNIWQTYRSGGGSIIASCSGQFCEANHDLFNGALSGVSGEADGWGSAGGDWLGSRPTYATPNASHPSYPAASALPGDGNGWSGDFRLASNSKGIGTDSIGSVAALPNFNDLDSALHVGAQPPNQSTMKFGRAAATGGGPTPPAGAPAFRAASSSSYGPSIGFRAASSAATDGVSLAVDRPAGTVANDVMIASISARPSSATIAAPAGWVLVRRVDNAAGQTISLATFRKVAGAGEPASYAWTVSGSTWSVGGIQSFSNVDPVNPIDVENGQATPGGVFTHATPSVTTTVANAMVVTSHTFATSTTWTPPSGMTEAFDVQFQPVTTNQGSSIEGNYVVQAAAGATGTKTATAAGGSGGEDIGAAHILALRPGGSVLGIEKPAGTAENDVMIASVSARPSSATISAPAGWTLVRRIDNAAGQTTSLAVFRKVAGAGEPASYTWDVSGATWAVAGIQSFSNVDTATPIDVENGQATSTGFTHATPSVTTTVANTMVVTSHAFATSETWTPPAGMTEAYDVQFQPTPANQGHSMEGNYAVQAAAGATGAKSATAAGGSGAQDIGAAHILTLRPGAP